MNQVFILFRLQKIDTLLEQISNRLQKIELLINENTTIIAAQKTLSEITSVYDQSQKEFESLEEKIQQHKLKIGFSESALYGGKVKNPKELQDLQNEIASLKKSIQLLEDEQLALMDKIDSQSVIKKAAEADLHQKQAEKIQQTAALQGEKSALEKSRETTQKEKIALLSTVEKDKIDLYNRLFLQKKGLVVAQIQDGSCDACGTSLTPSELQTTKASLKITYCTGCGRMLGKMSVGVLRIENSPSSTMRTAITMKV